MSTPPTYTHYVVQSLLPAVGWQAVYWVDTGHDAWPVHALALVYECTYNARTNARMPSPFGPAEEQWDIAGLVYSTVDSWNVCTGDSNYCGLLPPGTTLETFLESHRCH